MSDAITKVPEFLIQLKYQNNLPSAPSGPFFKKVNVFHGYEKFGEYYTSTLEKNYVWQPHVGLDVGVNLDLVDQDAMLAGTHDKNAPAIDPAELKYLTGTVDKGRGKQKQIDQSSKPWWLRNTTYMENNLFNAVNTKTDADALNKFNEDKRKQMGDVLNPFTTEYIDNSFELVDNTIKVLEMKATGKKSKVVWSVPILPLELESILGSMNERNFSLVRFDEDPTEVLDKVEGEDKQSDSYRAKRRRVNRAIATNFRQAVKSEHQIKAGGLELSLVAPPSAEAADGVTEEADEAVRYGWVKDYRMEVQDTKSEDCFLLLVNQKQLDAAASQGESVPEEAAVGSYFPIKARVDLKKLSREESVPCDSKVGRRTTNNGSSSSGRGNNGSSGSSDE